MMNLEEMSLDIQHRSTIPLGKGLEWMLVERTSAPARR